ncbi:MAG TPA: ATP-binding protein [bacterium]|nr:ATP-binding protein [bacterium]
MPGRRRTGQAAEMVGVTIPAKPDFVSVARLTAATVAARQAFSYDEIEDLKIAISEACNALILAGTSGSPLALRFGLEGATLEIRIETDGPGVELHPSPGPDKAPLDEGRLGVFLMQCLVDEVDARRTAQGKAELRLVKRRQR